MHQPQCQAPLISGYPALRSDVFAQDREIVVVAELRFEFFQLFDVRLHDVRLSHIEV